MKRVLMAFDSINLSAGDFDFIKQLIELQPVHLTGIFFSEAEVSYAHELNDSSDTLSVAGQTAATTALVNKFRTWCEGSKVPYSILLLDTHDPFEQLKKETRFADLLILSRVFYGNLPLISQYQYIHDIVHHAECAVLLLPEHCPFPKKVVLTYDGSSDSVFAIKQFTYLFPAAFSDVTLAYASGKDKKFPAIEYIKEYTARHYPGLSLTKIEADPQEYFSTWLQRIDAPLLVSGAFNRSPISELFKESFLENIVTYQSVPVFIAHK